MIQHPYHLNKSYAGGPIKYVFVAVSVFFGFFPSLAQKPAQVWRAVELKLSSQGKLAEIFDAGLRPYRFPSIENRVLECKHYNVTVAQPDGKRLPSYAAALIHINVYQPDWLGDMEFQNAKQTLVENRVEMLRWLPFGTMPKRTEADLDQFLGAVAADPADFDDPSSGSAHKFLIRWRDETKLDYNVWFQKSLDPAKPLAVYFKIGFPRSPGETLAYSPNPIKPPPGYEHVDMSAPKDFGPDSPPEDPEIERVRKVGVMPDYSMLTNQKPGIAKPVPSKLESEAPKGTPWWIMLSVAGLISLLLVLIRKHRRQELP